MSYHGHARAPWRDGLASLRRTVLLHPCPDAVAALACDQLGRCHGCDTWHRKCCGGHFGTTSSGTTPDNALSSRAATSMPAAVADNAGMPVPTAALSSPRPITPTLLTPVLPHRQATYLVGYARLKWNHLIHGCCIPSTIISSPHMHSHVNHPSALIHHQFVTTKLA